MKLPPRMKNNITRAAVTLLLTFIASATAWADPDLVIRSTADWNTFANSVNNGTSYQGQTVVLAADISVTTIVGSRSGTQPFDGTFDGCGHTLNLDLTVIDYYTAPFGAIQGANIKNLKTTGTVTGSMHSSGLVGIAHETNLIQNCEVAVSVVCSGNTHTLRRYFRTRCSLEYHNQGLSLFGEYKWGNGSHRHHIWLGQQWQSYHHQLSGGRHIHQLRWCGHDKRQGDCHSHQLL